MRSGRQRGVGEWGGDSDAEAGTSESLPRTLSSRNSVYKFVYLYNLLSNGSFTSKHVCLPVNIFGYYVVIVRFCLL